MDTSSESPLDEKDLHNILLWMPNWIGDVVLVLPALQALREKYPHSRITAVAKAPSDQLLFAHSAIDTVIQIPSGQTGGFLARLRFAGKLRKYQFDLGIVFPNSLESAILLSISGAKNRLGYDTEGRELFLTHPVPVTSQSKRTAYRVDYFFNAMAPLRLDPGARKFVALGKDQEDKAVEAFLCGGGWGENDFLVTLHPGTSKAPRGWHLERFGILCQKLAKAHKVKIVLLGHAGDAELLEKIRSVCPADTQPVPPDMDLRQVAALLQRSDLFIGNDSGMMHLAAMVGTPVVGIFGPGSPKTSGPYIDPEKQEIVTKNFPCSPCRQKFFTECKPSAHNKPYCLEDISVKDVSEAVERLMQKIEKKKRVSR